MSQQQMHGFGQAERIQPGNLKQANASGSYLSAPPVLHTPQQTPPPVIHTPAVSIPNYELAPYNIRAR